MLIEKVTPVIAAAPSDTWAFVSITTDNGIKGWGEFSGHPMSNAAVSAIINVFAPGITGKDPLQIEKCLAPITAWRYPSYLDDRMMIIALSALNMALWDIKSKYEGVPLYKLLGGQGGRQIKLYANLNRLLRSDRSLDKLVSAASRAVSDGFGMVKITPFDEVTPHIEHPDVLPGFERYRAVSGQVGAGRTSLDCHCRFTRDSFGKLLSVFGNETAHIPFIEDPVRIHWAKDIKPVFERYPNIDFASGEDCFSAGELNDLASSGFLKILNPDIKYIGGISGALRIVPGLLERGMNVSLHNPCGPIVTAHSAHVSTLCGKNTMLEFAYGDAATRNSAIGMKEPIENGVYYLSDTPGIGIEPSADFLEKYGTSS